MQGGVFPVEIRRLTVADVEDYRTIRLAALQGEPESFGALYEDEAARPLEAHVERVSASVVFGAYVNGKIIGMAGFKPEPGAKHRHKAFLWGMYVRPEARRRGAGAALIRAVLTTAEPMFEQLILTVVKGNEGARSLYEQFGFEVYGVEPRALKGAFGYVDEVLMVHFLREI